MKRCPTCGQVKSLEAFHRATDRITGRHSICKACRSEREKVTTAEPNRVCIDCGKRKSRYNPEDRCFACQREYRFAHPVRPSEFLPVEAKRAPKESTPERPVENLQCALCLNEPRWVGNLGKRCYSRQWRAKQSDDSAYRRRYRTQNEQRKIAT
jgi:hypothetical protein